MPTTDPAFDDGQGRPTGPPQDVIPLPTRLTREHGIRHPFVGAVWVSLRTSILPLRSLMRVDWACWEHRPIPQAACR